MVGPAPDADRRGDRPPHAAPPPFDDPAAWAWTRARLVAFLGAAADAHLDVSFPSSGSKTPVLVARASPTNAVVLKQLGRWSEVVTAIVHHGRLGRMGLPVPRVHGWWLSGPGRPLGPVVLEEWRPGRPFGMIAAEEQRRALPSIARALARWHAHRRRRPGYLLLPWPGSALQAYRPRVERRLQRLHAVLADDERRALEQSLEQATGQATGQAGRAASPAACALVHGHININNIMVDGDDPSGISFIDLGMVRYGDASQDVIRALQRLCRSADDRAEFLDVYFAEAGDAARARHAALAPFYACDYELCEAAGLLREAQRRGLPAARASDRAQWPEALRGAFEQVLAAARHAATSV